MPTYCVRKLELSVPRCFPGHSRKLRCGFEEQPSAVQMFALANSQPPSRGQAIHCRWALSHLHQCWNISIRSLSFLHEMHIQGELLWNNNAVTTNIQYITLIFSAFFFNLPNQCMSLANGAAQFGTSRKWPRPACLISQLALLSTIPPTPATFCSCHRAAWQDAAKSFFVLLWQRLDTSSPPSLLADRLAESGENPSPELCVLHSLGFQSASPPVGQLAK